MFLNLKKILCNEFNVNLIFNAVLKPRLIMTQTVFEVYFMKL